MASSENARDSEFLPPSVLDGKVFNGSWTSAASTATITEPATGRALGVTGIADAGAIADAAKSAAGAQREWAATSYEQRAAVLRAAARIAEENVDEIVDWVVRDSGSTRPKAAFEASITIKALHEAAGLPSRATGRFCRASTES